MLHFVAAKKSLDSTAHVFRANEIVTSSRTLLEEIAVLNARNSFARRGIDEQVETLHAVRDIAADAGGQAADEFKGTIAALDVANDRLQKTLASLRKAVIDPSLQRASNVKGTDDKPGGAAEGDDVEDRSGKLRTLYDFVDEATHEDLLSDLRGLIDSFSGAREGLEDSLGRFDDSIRSVADTIHDTSSSNEPPDKPTIYDEPPLPISQLFHGMEAHAAEMASLLESLVRHYDLSVTALKHTEGGGEAAKQAIPADELAKAPGVEESLYQKTVPEPISDDERTEMLKVLEHDAPEVTDVEIEIKDRISEMEGHYQQLARRASTARLSTKKLRAALVSLHQIREALPTYLEAPKAFRESWLNIQHAIEAKTKEIADLTIFYEQFLTSYKKLLREADRRRAAEAQMQKVAEKARKDLDRLYEVDKEARNEFVEEVGGFLPGDIWPALADGAARWEIRPMMPGVGVSVAHHSAATENERAT